jgi:hypothetical protein
VDGLGVPVVLVALPVLRFNVWRRLSQRCSQLVNLAKPEIQAWRGQPHFHRAGFGRVAQCIKLKQALGFLAADAWYWNGAVDGFRISTG